MARVWIIGGLIVAAAALFLVWPSSAPKSVETASPGLETPGAKLERRNERWFVKETTNVFTGVMAESDTNGVRLARVEISKGLADGWTEMYYTNGQKQLREHFKHGLSDGFREKWYASGQKLSEANIVNGKVVGIFQRWHENGQLAERIEMKDGQPDGVAWAYYPSGYVEAQTTLQEGKQLDRKLWKDGELKATQ